MQDLATRDIWDTTLNPERILRAKLKIQQPKKLFCPLHWLETRDGFLATVQAILRCKALFRRILYTV